MASYWTNKNAILRDLSVAQGSEVPVELENTLSFDEKPPPLNYTEETEEEFFQGCDGSDDFNVGPDIELIQHMLREVRDADSEENKEMEKFDPDTLVEISKINTVALRGAGDGDTLELENNNISSKQNNKPRKKRNVAVASLKELYGDKNNEKDERINSQKLLTPNDFIIQSLDETEKVNSIPIIKSPILMFKKKTPNPNKHNENTYQEKSTSPVTQKAVTQAEKKPGYFIPSSHAGEQYKEYLERSQVREQVNEDIWAKAERQMKEIDAKRQQEAQKSISPTNSLDEATGIEAHGIDYVCLPQHRHLLTSECTVCQVLCTHSKDELEEKKN